MVILSLAIPVVWVGMARVEMFRTRGPEEVLAGSVILDRSGRDTATSRLLITRQDRPGLFGTVNLVGRVTKGGEGLNAVVEGDRILAIQPATDSTPAPK